MEGPAGGFLQGIEPLGFLPVTLVAIVLCGLTPSAGRPADLIHLLDIMVGGVGAQHTE